MIFQKKERWLSVEELKEEIAFREAIEAAGGDPCCSPNSKSIYSNIDNNWGKNKIALRGGI